MPFATARSGQRLLYILRCFGTRHNNALTTYTSRNNSSGALEYMWASFHSGTVTILLTMPSRYRNTKVLLNIGLKSNGISFSLIP